MPSEEGNTLKFNQYMKPDKMSNIICADLEKSSTTKTGKHILVDIQCTYNILYIAGKIV